MSANGQVGPSHSNKHALGTEFSIENDMQYKLQETKYQTQSKSNINL